MYIAVRSQEESQKAIDELIFFLKLDLTDLVVIKVAAEEFIGKEYTLHGLYNNPRVISVAKNSTP